MKRVTFTVLVIFASTILFLHDASNAFLSKRTTISSEGSIFIPEILRVKKFGFRIADIMVDLIPPNFDDSWYENYWQQCLDDLVVASQNGETTHVQLRLFWRIDPTNRTTWEYPELGAGDAPSGGQDLVMQHWQSWIFGEPEPRYDPCAAERIHNAGLNLEICMSTSWYPGNGTLADVLYSVFGWDGREANAPEYPFDGELFLLNYMDNCLRPLAQFLANSSYFLDGDIFMLGFEMGYPTADFTWLHNERWISMINEIRQIFRSAGKSVVLTIDHSGWYNDWGLGHDAVALLSDNPPSLPGISGATYLAELDFISLSFWLEMLRDEDIPDVWDESYIDSIVVPAWYSCPRWFKTGTGHDAVPSEYGRNFIADFGALSQVMNGKKILLNTGYSNEHYTLVHSGRRSGDSPDSMAQKVAWVGQIRALGNNSWCAGQDFERYVLDKAVYPDHIDNSWRNAPAQDAIIEEIQAILTAP